MNSIELGREFREVKKILKHNSASGVLVGGKAFGLLAGHHEIEIAKRKDTDLFLIEGGTFINPSEKSKFDIFARTEDGIHRNSNGFALPYHIHYLGERLDSGLYILPPEAIYLTEIEMATRRGVDRVATDIIGKNYSRIANNLSVLPKEDLVMEFPGDFSWFGQASVEFPVQVASIITEDHRSNFFSFRWRHKSELPQPVFTNSRQDRTPEIYLNRPELNKELSEEQVLKLGKTLINAGFLVEGLRLIIEKQPELLEDMTIIKDIWYKKDEYPVKTAEAFLLWLDTVLKIKKPLLLFFSMLDIIHPSELAVIIVREHGKRYWKLVNILMQIDLKELIRKFATENSEQLINTGKLVQRGDELIYEGPLLNLVSSVSSVYSKTGKEPLSSKLTEELINGLCSAGLNLEFLYELIIKQKVKTSFRALYEMDSRVREILSREDFANIEICDYYIFMQSINTTALLDDWNFFSKFFAKYPCQLGERPRKCYEEEIHSHMVHFAKANTEALPIIARLYGYEDAKEFLAQAQRLSPSCD